MNKYMDCLCKKCGFHGNVGCPRSDAEEKAMNDSKPECIWKSNDDPDEYYFETTCGEEFASTTVPLEECNYYYCPKCGRKIRLA